MVRAISEQYEVEIKAGRKVKEIVISQIGYDHLNSELKNQEKDPEWTKLVKVENEVRRFEIRSGEE